MLLVIAYSRDARQSVRNVCRAHDDAVVRQYGRVALLEETAFGAFQVIRLREKHGEAVQVERTDPFNEFEDVPEAVREAARAYECRDTPSVPYRTFALDTDYPTKAEMREIELQE